MKINLNLNFLSEEEKSQARLLSALADFRELADRLSAGEEVSKAEIDDAIRRIDENQPDWRSRALPLREIRKRFEGKVSAGTIRRWAREGQIRAEKRGRNWYYDPEDVLYCIVSGEKEEKRGWPLGQPRG